MHETSASRPWIPAITYHTVCVQREPLQCQQRIVRLHYDVAGVSLVWKHRVRLDQLLRVTVVQFLQQVRTHARTRPSRNRVDEHEPLRTSDLRSARRSQVDTEERRPRPYLQAVAPIRLAIDHLHDFFLFVVGLLISCAGGIGVTTSRQL
jgi:hypothetical protein